MIVSMFSVRVPEQAIAGFEASWSKRAGQVDQMPGFRGMEVLRNGAEPGAYIVLTRWDSRADFERWASSPQFSAGHAHGGGGAATGAEGTGVTFYEIVPSTPT
ncbi:MAG: antibiotic biosynthesis monooxygenase [Ktedonobacterales bacterium]